MLAILSPAKNMKQAPAPGCTLTQPPFGPQASAVMQQLKSYAPWQLESLLHISPALALKAFQIIQDFPPAQQGVPALLAYDGLVFRHMAPESLTQEEMLFANDHLRILSACYGLLNPLDEIHPYRLEMQCRLPVENTNNLYQYWSDRLYRALFRTGDLVVNLASEEYAKAVRPFLTSGDRMIDISFRVFRGGKLRTMATWAKMARGQMARYLVKHRIDRPEALKDFTEGGYEFMPTLSSETNYVFLLR